MSESEEEYEVKPSEKKPKSSEKKPKLNDIHLDYTAAAKLYLDKLNAHIRSLGLTPKFDSLKAFKERVHVKDEIAYEKLQRAYKYFHDKIEPTSGKPPKLSSYAFMPPENPEVLPTYQPPKPQSSHLPIFQPPINQSVKHPPVNQDFSSIQMSGAKGKMDEEINPNSLFAKYYRDRSRGFKNQEFVNDWNASMKNLYGITGTGFNISHNPDYLRKDYFDWVVKKKHPDWTYSRELDLDGDKHNDVVIKDKAGNVRYFNGYGLSSNKFSLEKQDYMTDPETEDYDYKAFLNKYHEKHPPKPKKSATYADVTKAFIKWLQRKIKEAVGDSKQLKMLFKNSNLAGRVESLVNRFIVLPTMLIGQGYNEEEVKNIIFAAPKSKEEYILHAIYRDKELVDAWKKQSNKTILAQAVAYAILELGKLIAANVGDFIDLMFYKQGDMTVGTACYNAMIQTLNMGEEAINKVNVKTIIQTLNE